MAILKKGNSKYPFWGTPINLITGLDPLSLQTTSEATYATLLPGISNLTNRMRYYGFYCWLLSFYFKKEKKGNSKEQYKFIRRAELMIAILMQSERKNVQQITGSNFAANWINTIDGNFYDLSYGADRDNSDKDVYWKYPSGAFGQYYYGAMRSIGLVLPIMNEEGDEIYNVTDPHPRQKVSGIELAEAFDSSLNESIKDKFINNIKSGKLFLKDIPELIKFFYIDQIDPTLPEWSLYKLMLLDKDDPTQELEENFTYHRKETIQKILINNKKNNGEYDWYSFLLDAYASKLGKGGKSETEIGWYAYQLNEYYQYSCGTIFWSALMHLYNVQKELYLPDFVSNLAKLISIKIGKELDIDNTAPLNEVVSKVSAYKNEQEIWENIDTGYNSDPIEAGTNGFLLLFKLYQQNINEAHQLQMLMSRKDMIKEGNVLDGLFHIHNSMNEELEKFIENYLIRKILYRHQMVALRKMGNGSQSTQKFMIEEQYIKFIDTFPPRFTSPRMGALQNLLWDLRIVDSEGKLTSLSNQFINENRT